MKILTVKIPKALDNQLREIAAESGETTSGLVREALAEYIAKPQHRRKKGSALDLVGDLAGSLEGPADLATNPKHMRGFGK